MSISAANLSTKAKIVERLPSFSEEVISNKLPRSWNDLPDHLLEMIFHSLTKDDKEGRMWVSRAGRVCKNWRRVSKDLLLGDTAASRPKRVQMITSEVHDNKTTLATKGDLVEESVVNSASEVEACSKRQRLDSSSLHFPAFSDGFPQGEASLQNRVPMMEEVTQEASLASHLVKEGQNQLDTINTTANPNSANPAANATANNNNNQTLGQVLPPAPAAAGSVGQVDPPAQAPAQAAVSVDTIEAQRSGHLESNHDDQAPSSSEGKCRTSYLGGVIFGVNGIVKNFAVGSPIMPPTTSTET